MSKRPKVIIIGAGFGGLFASRAFAKHDVDILMIDRNNYHTFTPLIYQVATCALGSSEVAYPIRTILRKNRNTRFLLGEVTAIDTDNKSISVEAYGNARQEKYDYLIVAGGSTTTYFGNDHFRDHAFELNTLNDAVRLRNHILRLFERAAWESDFSKRDALTTIVVVGGGPTGLETAGAIFELYNHVLDREFKDTPMRARVILVELLPNLLSPYPEKLQDAALKQLTSLGVEVIFENPVKDVQADKVTLGDGTVIPTYTMVWSAGVRANPLAEMLGVELARAARVPVKPTMQVKGLDDVYVIGDMAYLEDENGDPYPMMIPVAMQQAYLTASNITASIGGKTLREFDYQDRGIMATIGRRRAVAWIFKRIPMQGFLAWLAWLFLHLVTLLGFRNRVSVLMNWIYNYFTYDRSVRIIIEGVRDWDSAEELTPADAT